MTNSGSWQKYLPLSLLIPAAIIAIDISEPGAVLGGGDFPFLDTPSYAEGKLSLWTENGSYPGFERLPRLPFIAFSYLLSFTGITSEIVSKAMVLSGFLAASFSFYFMYTSLSRLRNEFSFYISVGAIIGALFYAYNPWSFERIGHWYFWIGYSLLPLFVLLLVQSLTKPTRYRYIFGTILVATAASTTPHMTIFYFMTFALVSLVFALRYRGSKMYSFKKPIAILVLSYLGINAFWIYPAAMSSSSISLAPQYVNTVEAVEMLSRDSNAFNVLRLTQNWIQPRTLYAEPEKESAIFPFWIIASITLPILAFLSVVFRRNDPLVIILLILGSVGILFSMGSRGPGELYSTVLFSSPLISNISWLFRDPDKWAFMIAFAFSYLSSITIKEALRRINRLHLTNGLAVTLVVMIIASHIIYIHDIYDDSIVNAFEPISIPNDFEQLNGYLGSLETDKVFFLPYQPSATSWSQGHNIGRLYQASSTKPNIEPTTLELKFFFNYFGGLVTSSGVATIGNFLSTVGTNHVIFHEDTTREMDAKLKESLLAMKDVKDSEQLGFFRILKTDGDAGQGSISGQNIAVVGGLDKFGTLDQFSSFNVDETAVVFLESTTGDSRNEFLERSDMIVHGASSKDLTLSLIPEKYLVAPTDATNHHNPSRFWSKSGTSDPLHGPFHPYLSDRSISNWDFDYGKGVVITWSQHRLEIPFAVDSEESYSVYVRYLASTAGGAIGITLDEDDRMQIETLAGHNQFKWKKIETRILSAGGHKIAIDNLVGLNAINLLAVIPEAELATLEAEISSQVNRASNLHLMEAESALETEDTGTENTTVLFSTEAIPRQTVRSGNFTVPEGAQIATVQLLAEPSVQLSGQYQLNDFSIESLCNENAYLNDFENDIAFLNLDTSILLPRIDKSNPIEGEKSQRVDVRTHDGSKRWSVMSTDFFSVQANINYVFNLSLEATDVKSLHSKVHFYDANKDVIHTAVFFGDVNGSHKGSFSKAIIAPEGARFAKLQLWTTPVPGLAAFYSFDAVKVERSCIANIDGVETFESSTPQVVGTGADQLYMNATSPDSDSYYILKSAQFQVREGAEYSYSVNVESDNIEHVIGQVVFRTSGFPVLRYGSEAGNGGVVHMREAQWGNVKLDLAKSTVYTVGIRAEVCDACETIQIAIGNVSRSLAVEDNKTGLQWIYFDAYLEQGENRLRIKANDTLKVDMIAIYDSRGVNPDEILSPRSPPAVISAIESVSPAKYIVRVNASEPYLLTFAEAYNPLWVANTGNNTTTSIPIYSITNGFMVNEIGEYDLTIEFVPQTWLTAGAMTSLIALALLILYSVLARKTNHVKKDRTRSRKHAVREDQEPSPNTMHGRRMFANVDYASFLACAAAGMLVLAAVAEISGMANYADTVALYAYYVVLMATLWMIITWVLGRARVANMTPVTATSNERESI